jgi:kynureninase
MALEAHRAKFPILADSTYLVSHSMGAVPAKAANYLHDYHAQWAHEGIAIWERWMPFVEECQGLLGRILGAPGDSIAFHQNVSTLFVGVLSCFDWSAKRNKVLYPELGFPTLKYNLQTHAALGLRAIEIPSADGIHQPAETFINAIDDETALVVLDHGIYRSSALIDVKPIIAAAHQKGAKVIVDVYQTAGVIPLNIDDWGADFVVGGSHKWLCGGPGASFLHIHPDLLPSLHPKLFGWMAQADIFRFADKVDPADSARRFMTGSFGMPALYAARAGWEAILDIGVHAIRPHNLLIAERILEAAQSRGFRVNSPLKHELRGGQVCVDFEGAERMEPLLQRRRIFLDHRPGCGLRISGHFYSKPEEVDELFEALDELRA